jgi:ketosteroid isomerase-like protein
MSKEGLMSVNDTHVNDPRLARLRAMFAAIDDGDTDELLTYFAPEARQTFGNMAPLEGRDAIRDGNVSFLSSISGTSHEIIDAWECDGTVAVQLRVTYERLDGARVTIPALSLFSEGDGMIRDYKVFFDTTPVYAEHPVAAGD